jgi:hypothetical protein
MTNKLKIAIDSPLPSPAKTGPGWKSPAASPMNSPIKGTSSSNFKNKENIPIDKLRDSIPPNSEEQKLASAAARQAVLDKAAAAISNKTKALNSPSKPAPVAAPVAAPLNTENVQNPLSANIAPPAPSAKQGPTPADALAQTPRGASKYGLQAPSSSSSASNGCGCCVIT